MKAKNPAKRCTPVPGLIRVAAAGCFVLLCAWLPGVGAVTVHTWVDAAGVRHFADTPPADGAIVSEAMEVAATGASSAVGAEDDYYSIVNQWARLREERDANDARALERERLRNERELGAQPAPIEPVRQGNYYVPYGIAGYGHHRGHGGSHHGEVPRSEYVTAKRRHAFVPIPAPRWPR